VLGCAPLSPNELSIEGQKLISFFECYITVNLTQLIDLNNFISFTLVLFFFFFLKRLQLFNKIVFKSLKAFHIPQHWSMV